MDIKKGIYILIIYLNKPKKIKIGTLGNIFFKKGYYCYIGSALNNLEKRVQRHLSSKKKIRWHIDYLLKHAKIINVKVKITNRKLECSVNKKVEKNSKEVIKSFGSSDCNCKGHLWYFEKKPNIKI
ncbi:MAG TPA: GIY-YIG nuclease family protein [Candidatus Woesearchaeota archaeon]|jgi:Uri superfamily endonuclease|nr:GIY-YIG nuclease family protein [Candidatus Woesearchaeota archaeon]HJN56839.1 GIY-YIG nuclease family protein [Candidatus Woesearchaeota archaeon]|tara:strand:+ start:11343 stop:11720 length:378 start_codon:yes stop_codon:yes gene_type:complete